MTILFLSHGRLSPLLSIQLEERANFESLVDQNKKEKNVKNKEEKTLETMKSSVAEDFISQVNGHAFSSRVGPRQMFSCTLSRNYETNIP
jgi:hypothetical protein